MNNVQAFQVLNEFMQQDKSMKEEEAWEYEHEQKSGIEEQLHIVNSLQRRLSELSQPQLRYTYSGVSNASNSSDYSFYATPPPEDALAKRKFIKDEQLFNSLKAKTTQLNQRFCIQEEETIMYLMYKNRWESEQASEQFFKESEFYTQFSQKITKAMNSQTQHSGVCPVCLSEQQLLYSNFICEHYFCKKCWNDHIYQNLSLGKIYFPCLEGSACKNSPVLKKFVKYISPEHVDSYRKKICISYAIEDKSLSYCPNYKCPYFCEQSQFLEFNSVQCFCGEMYCCLCEKEVHYPALCSDVQKWEKLINSKEVNEQWIALNTKSCPKCKYPIQKTIGCSKMTCTCSFIFCYECGLTWDQHHKLKFECPTVHKKKQNKQEYGSISNFNSKIIQFKQSAVKDLALINECLNEYGKHADIKSKLVELSKYINEAWLLLKWVQISLFLAKATPIDEDLESDYLKSIRSLMEIVQALYKSSNSIYLKELFQFAEKMIIHKENLKKNQKAWMDAYESSLNF